ncbi:MAG: 1-acyl-sn-glycerol-3-phosphate acyltransferase [Flavobacteriaceae bacterium]|nr:1-acyl-sn-glycerol-3-phosphate acyltransferase [Flavobacteriaceae bacterium]
MAKLWLDFMRNYVRLGLFFYYKKIITVGKENIPKKGAIIFLCNHQNALIDPLIIGTTDGRSTHFLTKAGVFKNNLIIRLFHSVQMIPIYRLRDGRETLIKNEVVFNKCINLLNEQKALVIFPEGSHSLLRKVRPLKSGFSKILFDTFEKHPKLEIKIIPVGLNYNSITEYPSSVSIHYGKPIDANKYWDKNNIDTSKDNIKEVVSKQISLLTTHIEDSSNYDNIHNQLIASDANFLDPIATNKQIKSIDPSKETVLKPTKTPKNILYYIVVLNSIIPWLLLKKISKGIKEREFISSLRYGIGISVFPIFYVIQAIVLSFIFDAKIGLYYFAFSILSGLILTKFSKNAIDKS